MADPNSLDSLRHPGHTNNEGQQSYFDNVVLKYDLEMSWPAPIAPLPLHILLAVTLPCLHVTIRTEIGIDL